MNGGGGLEKTWSSQVKTRRFFLLAQGPAEQFAQAPAEQ